MFLKFGEDQSINPSINFILDQLDQLKIFNEEIINFIRITSKILKNGIKFKRNISEFHMERSYNSIFASPRTAESFSSRNACFGTDIPLLNSLISTPITFPKGGMKSPRPPPNALGVYLRSAKTIFTNTLQKDEVAYFIRVGLSTGEFSIKLSIFIINHEDIAIRIIFQYWKINSESFC